MDTAFNSSVLERAVYEEGPTASSRDLQAHWNNAEIAADGNRENDASSRC